MREGGEREGISLEMKNAADREALNDDTELTKLIQKSVLKERGKVRSRRNQWKRSLNEEKAEESLRETQG